jgi:hypothetical protein
MLALVGTIPDETLPGDPQGVWRLVVRADELRKYASNRDPAVALAQAEEVLERAAEAAAALTDKAAAAGLAQQIRTRLEDIAKAREGT